MSESLVEKMLDVNGFNQLDDNMWMLEIGEEVLFIQKEEKYWEVYWKNKMIQHSDDEMINGIELFADID